MIIGFKSCVIRGTLKLLAPEPEKMAPEPKKMAPEPFMEPFLEPKSGAIYFKCIFGSVPLLSTCFVLSVP